jgi:hypothetical protein
LAEEDFLPDWLTIRVKRGRCSVAVRYGRCGIIPSHSRKYFGGGHCYLLQEIELDSENRFSKELEGAKKYLMGSFPMRLDTQGKLVNFLGQVEYFGLGLKYPESYPSIIQAVTREDVLRVAKTYLHPESIILVVVANLNEAKLE